MRQIQLVQESFALVLPLTVEAATEFYRRLFQIAPSTRALFKHDMAEQGRKLFLTLASVVDALDNLDDVLPVASALAIRHVSYGVRAEDYAAVGTALVQTLSHMLGDRFDAETKAAWESAYGLLSSTMIQAAYVGERKQSAA